jgi:hypothetical protein
MSTRTPGPWHYQERLDDYTHIVRGRDGFFICQLDQDRSGRSEANARLIATAPELLEACKRLRKWCMLHEDSRFADTVIAKAEEEDK